MTIEKRHLKKFIFFLSMLVAVVVAGWKLRRCESYNSPSKSATRSTAVKDGKVPDSTSRSIAQSAEERVSKLKQMVVTSNVPIEFWGKVMDETGAALSGVRIAYLIQKASLVGVDGFGPTKSGTTVLSTDGDGLFSVMNDGGVILDIESLQKEGYELMGSQRMEFAYSRTPEIHVPDRDNPHVFVMKSSKALNDVKTVSRKMQLPWDGKAIRLDLDSGEISPSGNLIITASRAASPGQVRGFEWRFSLEIRGGGLQQELQREAALIAPEDGYQSSWSLGSRADEQPWNGGYSGNLYFKISGKFGRLNIDLHPDARADETSLYLERIINTGGGRNTE